MVTDEPLEHDGAPARCRALSAWETPRFAEDGRLAAVSGQRCSSFKPFDACAVFEAAQASGGQRLAQLFSAGLESPVAERAAIACGRSAAD